MIRVNPSEVISATANASVNTAIVRGPGGVTLRPDRDGTDNNDRPDIAGPIEVRPGTVRPDGDRPDVDRSNSDRPNSDRPNSDRPDLVRPDLVRPGADRSDDNIIEGTEKDDILYGTDGDDVIWAKGGNDSVRAGGGDDLVRGGNGNDRLSGGDGADKIAGGAGNDLILGGNGEDLLFGGAGNDHISGGNGNDTLVDSIGGDSYSGGAGADTFVFGYTNRPSAEHGTGRDRIRDFSREDGDRLQIQGDNMSAHFSYGDSDGDGADDFTIISLIDLSGPERAETDAAASVQGEDDGTIVGAIMVQDALLTLSDVEFI